MSEPSKSCICIACKSEIPDDATICTHCHSFQRRWKNELRYYAHLAGIATVAAAVITYIITAVPDIRRLIAWPDDIDVLFFSVQDRVVLVNAGDGEVFVTHLFLEGFFKPSRRFTRNIHINRVVRPGETLSTENTSRDLMRLPDYRVVAKVSDQEWKGIIGLADHPGRSRCYVAVFMSPDDPNFLMYNEVLGEELRTFPAEGQIHYYAPHVGMIIEEKVPAIGIILANPANECAQ